MLRIFLFPINAHNPPARAVVHQLKAVDAAGKWLLAFCVARLIGAPDVSDAIPAIHVGGKLIFKKTFLAEEGLSARLVFIRRKRAGANHAFVVTARGNEPCPGNEEAAKTVPIARTWRAGNHIIHRSEEHTSELQSRL